MTKQLRNLFSLTTCVLVCLLALSINGNSQTDDKAKKEQEKKGGGIGGAFKGVGDKITGKKPSEEKTELEYKKLLEKAKAKYDDKTKPSFKERVDRAYRQKRREHNNYAFQMNTFNSNDELTTFTGDKVKMEDTIYDNLMVQNYINRVGHSLVPSQTHRYVFKVVLDPVPDARALTTGTIFLTTGLLSLVDNEAQLAYVLAHEIVHVEKMHWLQDAMVAIELEDQENSKREKAAWISFASAIGIGAATRSTNNGIFAGLIAGVGSYGLLKFFDDKNGMEWEIVQENEADKEALNLILNRNYDLMEIPRFYARLQELTDREPRLADGFLARATRVDERFGYLGDAFAPISAKAQMFRGASNLRRLREKDQATSATFSPLEAGKQFPKIDKGKSFLNNADLVKAEKDAVERVNEKKDLVAAKIERGEIVGASQEFDKVMADLKRDNGLRAFYFDMFNLALENLGEARKLRPDDPHAHFYYGKVLETTAKNRAEKAEAIAAFDLAIEHDRRQVLAEPHLYRAVMLMSNNNPNQNRTIIEGLGKYVEIYTRTRAGNLPPNMDIIYTYLKGLGEHNWAMFPAQNVYNSRNTEGSREVDPPKATETVASPETQASPVVKPIETKTAPVQPDPKKATPPKKKP